MAIAVSTLLWLSLVFAELPWTRPYAARVFLLAAAPFAEFGESLWPMFRVFFFVIGIGVVTWGAIRLVKLFFRQVETGALTIENFPEDWAAPTYRLVRLLLLAVALVAVFPYIPGSNSPAFQGVSLFIGFLVSISSSSALSNVIAGTILTYTRAFRVGDMVCVGQTTGRVVARSLLVTRVRTPKNLVVTIPNAIVLGGQVINYTEESRKDGIILHTSVTIGYDAPWREVHAALIAAARATPGVAETPARLCCRPHSTTSTSPTRSTPTAKEPDLPLAYSALPPEHPGRVQRRRHRDHVAALQRAARRQYHDRAGGLAPAGLPASPLSRGRLGAHASAPAASVDFDRYLFPGPLRLPVQQR